MEYTCKQYLYKVEQNPWFHQTKFISLSPRRKGGSLQRTGVSSPRVWWFSLDPQGVGLQGELEGVQKRANKFIKGNYKTGSMTGILGQLK